MMGVALGLVRNDALELLLDFQRRFAGRKAGAVADPEEMGVDGDGRVTEGDVENDIGGLPTDARQGLQVGAVFGHRRSVLFDQLPRQGDDVAGLGAE